VPADDAARGRAEEPSTASVVEREAARVLLLDGRGRLLLLAGVDPADPGAGSWWFTPGGGADPGVTAEQTARRELWEETGLRVGTLDGPVAERTAQFHHDGVSYRQHEQFFVARLPEAEVALTRAAWTELETRAVVGCRWWGEPELAETQEVVHPGWLGAWLTAETHGRRAPGPGA